MNSVDLIGRLVRDPEVRYSSDGKAVANFSLAVERDGQKDETGKKLVDYPRIVVFGRPAETCEKYLTKGKQVGIQGRLQTGSYTNKKGDTVHTTEVLANRVDLIWEPKQEEKPEPKPEPQQEEFEEIDEDVPF